MTRWGRPWFTISLGIIVGVMMVSYVAVPARLIGAEKRKQSTRDKLSTSVVGGALSATICTPPYLLGRLGFLALGSSAVLVFTLGLFALSLGVTLQAGATGAVRAIKMSATLTTGRRGDTVTNGGREAFARVIAPGWSRTNCGARESGAAGVDMSRGDTSRGDT